MAGKDLSTINSISVYQGLMRHKGITSMTCQEALEHMSKLCDLSFSLKQEEGLMRSIEMGMELEEQGGLSPLETSRINYFVSNAWEKLRLIKSGKGASPWEWEQPEIEKQVIHLKRAIHREALKDMSTKYVCQVLSNMGALLNHVGRFSEALEYWDRAVAFKQDFAIGRGKRGYALTHYSQVLYDEAHVEKFLKKARGDLEAAVSGDLYDSARLHFRNRLDWVNTSCPSAGKGRDLALFRYAEASSPQEVSYRRWCLENRLFLNPLNDLGPYPAAMKDDLSVPSVVAVNSGGAYYQGLFNQMKQAYVSARYLYYEGITAEDPHFSDRDVLLFDTMDYPSYSLYVEKVKAAFNMTYSIFDKIAHIINFYMGLRVPDEYVTFRSVWYRDQSRANGLREEFLDRKNWPMRGLFWLSKDIFEDQPGFDEALEPDAREFSDARYNIERRYLKLHDDFFSGFSSDTASPPDRLLMDSLAMSMKRGEFEARALRLLKKAHSALMYLTFALHHEEKVSRARSHIEPELPALSLSVLNDSWKV
jgi:hypothetical protein